MTSMGSADKYGILAWQEFLSNQKFFRRSDRGNFLEGASGAVLRLGTIRVSFSGAGGNEFGRTTTGARPFSMRWTPWLRSSIRSVSFHRASPYMGDDPSLGSVARRGAVHQVSHRCGRPQRGGHEHLSGIGKLSSVHPGLAALASDTTFIDSTANNNTRFQHLAKLSRYSNELRPSPRGSMI